MMLFRAVLDLQKYFQDNRDFPYILYQLSSIINILHYNDAVDSY